jgi:hypothetical protein
MSYKITDNDIIIDASDFLDEIPRLHQVHTASSLGTEWLYNNFAIRFHTHVGMTISNYMKNIVIPSGGNYYLYVRSVGSGWGNFRIRLNDCYVDGVFGNVLGASMRKVGAFCFKQEENINLMITRITGTPALDVIILSKNPALQESDLKNRQLPDDVVLVREYDIPTSSCVKFGDLTGDGKTDFVVLTDNYSSYAFDNNGKELWRWEAPEDLSCLRSEFEAPGVVWNFDRSRKADFVQWREFDGKEWLVVADGMTGTIKAKTRWPTKKHPHVYNNFRIAIANLDGKYPNGIIVYSDCGGLVTIAAYDSLLNLLWQRVEQVRKDHLGHYVYPRDLNGDGIDEILCGWLLLDKDGNELWSRLPDIYDNHDHVDSYAFADVNGDGKEELIVAVGDFGTQVRDTLTSKLLWMAPCEHNQQIAVGKFLTGYNLAQVAAGARIYKNHRLDPYISAQVYWFDNIGNLISKWPANELNGNPVFAKGDWYGNGSESLFWYRFMLLPDGKGKLYFTGNVYHCFDFEKNGAAQVITLDHTKLRVWGYKYVKSGKPNNDPDFIRHTITNHTHY